MLTSQTQLRHHPRGFSLIELCVTIVIIASMALTLAPALAQVRTQSRTKSSAANLMAIGQGRDMYAKDSKDRIYTYTWLAGVPYLMPDGTIRTSSTDTDAASRQNQEIIMRRTGRINGTTKILTFSGRIPHRRFSHLILMDYLAGDDDSKFAGPLFADPEDQDLLNWQERPLDYRVAGSGWPFANGLPAGSDQDPNWTQQFVLQRWPFTSSYFSTPFAWQGDGPHDVYVPISSTTHLFSASGSPDLSGRYMNQVRFPSKKVNLFEEFDRQQKRFPYFAYDHAQPEKLMFDGSINTQVSGEAQSSVSPSNPTQVWTQRYVPLDVFPIPIDGVGSTQLLNMRYMWTKDGLQGYDYTNK